MTARTRLGEMRSSGTQVWRMVCPSKSDSLTINSVNGAGRKRSAIVQISETTRPIAAPRVATNQTVAGGRKKSAPRFFADGIVFRRLIDVFGRAKGFGIATHQKRVARMFDGFGEQVSSMPDERRINTSERSRSTVALSTPGSAFNARSTRPAQLVELMPRDAVAARALACGRGRVRRFPHGAHE